jgi:hypothetical protein
MLPVDLVENLLIAPFFQSRPAPWARCGGTRGGQGWGYRENRN